MAYMGPVPFLLTCAFFLSGGLALADPERRPRELGTTSSPSQDLIARAGGALPFGRLNGRSDHGELGQTMSPGVSGRRLMTGFAWTFTNRHTQHRFSVPVNKIDNSVQSRKHACAQ